MINLLLKKDSVYDAITVVGCWSIPINVDIFTVSDHY